MPEPPQPPHLSDFQLLRWIGGGSYGNVWLARSVTGMYRAVKVVRRDKFDNPRPYLRELEGITRFQKSAFGKARQLALLHVGIQEDAGFFYYVMELADDAERGSEIDPAHYVALTLKERLQRHGRIAGAECLRLAVELTQALGELHDLGLIHRDIKPSNLVFVNGLPKIADVGLVSSAEVSLSSVGTPGYEAPEGPGSRSADLYSLGKVIYVAATGLAAGEFPRLPPELKDWPDAAIVFELNEVLTRACAHHPADRYADASAMLEDLRLIQAGRSLKELSRLRRTARRAARVSAVVVAVAAIVSGFFWQRNRANRRLAEHEVLARRQIETQAAETRAALYAANLGQAQLALQLGDLGLARVALRAAGDTNAGKDLRNFEWRVLQHQAAGDPAVILTTTNRAPLDFVAVSRDGRRVATVGADFILRIWDTANPNNPPLVKTDVMRLGAFNAEGTRVSASTTARQVGWINVADGQPVGWSAAQGSIVTICASDRVVVLSPPGQPDEFQLWDPSAQQPQARVAPGPEWSGWDISAVAASPDGRRLAVTFYSEKSLPWRRALVVWDFVSGRELWRTNLVDRVNSLAFSPAGPALAVGMSGAVILVFPNAGTANSNPNDHFHLEAPRARIRGLAFSDDSKQLGSAGDDLQTRIWNLETKSVARTYLGHEAEILDLKWRSDGRVVTASHDGSVRVWEASPIAAVSTIAPVWGDSLGGFSLHPTGDRIAVTDPKGDLAMIHLGSGQREQTLGGGFIPLFFDADGATLWSLTTNQAIVRWDWRTGASTTVGNLPPRNDLYETWTSSTAKQTFALGYKDGTAMTAGAATGGGVTLIPTGTNTVQSVSLAPDGVSLVTGSSAGEVREWRLPEGTAIGAYPRQPEPVTCLAHSPDGRHLVVGIKRGAAQLFNVPDRRLVATLRGHRDSVRTAAFSPDGQRLVTAGNEAAIVIWSVPAGQQLVSLPVPQGPGFGFDPAIAQLEFSRDGNLLAGMTEDGRIILWRTSR
jgi:WD40 repeat protein